MRSSGVSRDTDAILKSEAVNVGQVLAFNLRKKTARSEKSTTWTSLGKISLFTNVLDAALPC